MSAILSVLLAVFTVCVSPPEAFAKESPCSQLLLSTALKVEQAKQILAAMAGETNLQFRILNKRHEGHLKTVVLLGENHMAEQSDIDLAKPLVDSFPDIATENGSTNLGPKYEYKFLNLATWMVLPTLALELTKPGKGQGSPMNLPLKSSKVREVFSAEDGHEPSRGEEMNLLGIAAIEAANFYCKGACALYALMSLPDLKAHFVGLALAGGYYMFSKLGLQPGLNKLLPYMPLVKNRDRTMVANINRYVERTFGEDSLLVIVGQAHLPGITKELVETYGYEEALASP